MLPSLHQGVVGVQTQTAFAVHLVVTKVAVLGKDFRRLLN